MAVGLISIAIHPHRHILFASAIHWPPPPASSLARRRRFSPVFSNLVSEIKEIRVCTNRTCRKQGSLQALEALSGIAPPNVTVKTCGCLGRCGSGPNIGILPEGLIVSHCGTAARAARILCESEDVLVKSLKSLALRKRAGIELDRKNYVDAEMLLTQCYAKFLEKENEAIEFGVSLFTHLQAIDLKPVGGIHSMHIDRSAARLAMNNYDGAMDDAKEAIGLALQCSKAYICEGDAFMAMEQYNEAEKSYSIALDLDPSIRRSRSFKSRVQKLQEKLIAADTP